MIDEIFIPILDLFDNNQSLHIYPDSLFHLFPIENIFHKGQYIGNTRPIANVLQSPKDKTHVKLQKGILLLTEIPEVKPSFSYLHHTIEEGNQIADLFEQKNYPYTHLKGQDANVSAFKKEIEKGVSIIHIAAHGYANPFLPPETISLILAQESNDPKTIFLTYHDIMKMDLSFVDLVVLSACNSSIGKTNKSSTLQGLTFAFLSAGVSYVVASRIPVRDEATSLIMRTFYQNLMHTDVLNSMRITRNYFSTHDERVTNLDMASWGVWM